MRIAVIGPQNTGKTTFVKDFLAALPSYTTPSETYRDVVREKGLIINRDTTEDSQRAIRDFFADQLATHEGSDVIFDRCVIDNYVYTKAQHLAGRIEKAFVEETEAVMRASLSHVDAYVFIPTASSVAFVDDALRDTNTEFADYINTLFIELLLELRSVMHHPVVVISGPRELRVNTVRRALSL